MPAVERWAPDQGIGARGDLQTKRTLRTIPGQGQSRLTDGLGVSGGHGATAALRGGRGGPCLGIGLQSRRARWSVATWRATASRSTRRLEALRVTYQRVRGYDPSYDDVRRSRRRGASRRWVPAPALVRGPADRAGDPGAPAQPTRGALPRPEPESGRPPTPTRWSSWTCDRRSGVADDMTVPLDRLAAARRGRRGHAHGLRRATRPIGRLGRPPLVVLPGATTASAAGRPCCAGARHGTTEASARVWIEGLPRPSRRRRAPRRARPLLNSPQPASSTALT